MTHCSLSSGNVTRAREGMLGPGHEALGLGHVRCSVSEGTSGWGYEGLASGTEAEAGHRELL